MKRMRRDYDKRPAGSLTYVFIGGHSRIRTYDFHRVKVALYR